MTTQTDELRAKLAETIPPGGKESDTLFTNKRLQIILDGVGGDLLRASHQAWIEKAGIWAGLVDVVEGNSSREMGQLHKAALAQIAQIESELNVRDFTGSAGHVKIGRIQRSGYA